MREMASYQIVVPSKEAILEYLALRVQDYSPEN